MWNLIVRKAELALQHREWLPTKALELHKEIIIKSDAKECIHKKESKFSK